MPEATLGSVLLRIGVALVAAFPIAWDRERATHLMGLRTFPIVAMSSCAYLLLIGDLGAGNVDAQARVLQGLITGMGFIGGGAILKHKGRVEGTATAASLWATGAIGAAAAYERWSIVIAVTAVVFLTLRTLPWIEKVITKGQEASQEGTADRT